MSSKPNTPATRWRKEFDLSPGLADNVQRWVLEDLNNTPVPLDDLRAIAVAVSDTSRDVRTTWAHAAGVRVDVALEYGAIEIRLTPLGENAHHDRAEWLVYRPA